MEDWQACALAHGFRRFVERPGCTVRSIWESESCADDDAAPFIREVYSEDRFGRMVSKLRWVERRKNHFARIERAVIAGMATRAVQEELGQIEDLERARKKMLDHVFGTGGEAKMKPKSAEGAATAVARLDTRIAAKRGAVSAAVAVVARVAAGSPPGASPAGAAVIAELDRAGGFTDDEIETMAKALAAQQADDAPTAAGGRPPTWATREDGSASPAELARPRPEEGRG